MYFLENFREVRAVFLRNKKFSIIPKAKANDTAGHSGQGVLEPEKIKIGNESGRGAKPSEIHFQF